MNPLWELLKLTEEVRKRGPIKGSLLKIMTSLKLGALWTFSEKFDQFGEGTKMGTHKSSF